MKYTLRAALAVTMLLGVYVLALAIIAGLAFGIYEIVTHGVTGALVLKLFVVALLASAAIARGLWAGLRQRSGDEPGVLLSPAEQPRLWDEVRFLADEVCTRPPDEIRLVPEVNAAVAEGSRWLGLVPGTRRMYIGVPLLTGLSQLQLRSVLAHELGHYGGRHTALAGVTYRGQESLRRIVGHLGLGSWIGRIFRSYGRLYVAVASTVNRRQELEADMYSARLAGRGPAISALQAVPAIDVAWSVFWDSYLGHGSRKPRRPRDLFGGFHQFWSTPERQRQLEEVRSAPPAEERSIYDSHPGTAERVAALAAVTGAPDVPDESGPAIDLLDDTSEVLARLEAWMFGGTSLPAVPWEEFAAASFAEETHANAATLIAAMESGGESRASLGQALDALDLGWSLDLVAPLMPEAAPEDQRRTAASQLVGDLVADALVQQASASYRLDWAVGRRLVAEDGTELDPWSLARSAVASAEETSALRDWCAAHDVPLGHRPTH